MGQHLTITTRNSDLKHENSNLFFQTLRAFLGAVKVHNFYLNLVCKVKLIQYLQGLQLMLTCSVSQHADPGRQLGNACSIITQKQVGVF